MQTRSKPSDLGIFKIFLNREVANLAPCTHEEKEINTLLHILYLLWSLWRNFLNKFRHILLQKKEYFDIEIEKTQVNTSLWIFTDDADANTLLTSSKHS